MSAEEQAGPLGGGMPPRSGGPVIPQNPPCPICARRTVIRQVTPVLFASELDDVTYGCETCGTKVKRTVKRS